MSTTSYDVRLFSNVRGRTSTTSYWYEVVLWGLVPTKTLPGAFGIISPTHWTQSQLGPSWTAQSSYLGFSFKHTTLAATFQALLVIDSFACSGKPHYYIRLIVFFDQTQKTFIRILLIQYFISKNGELIICLSLIMMTLKYCVFSAQKWKMVSIITSESSVYTTCIWYVSYRTHNPSPFNRTLKPHWNPITKPRVIHEPKPSI